MDSEAGTLSHNVTRWELYDEQMWGEWVVRNEKS